MVYIRHIIDCAIAIEKYTSSGKESFINDRKTIRATLRELQGLSESTKRVSDSFKQLPSDVPWQDFAGFRNVLVHDYLGLNPDRIWEIIENDLPGLKRN